MHPAADVPQREYLHETRPMTEGVQIHQLTVALKFSIVNHGGND